MANGNGNGDVFSGLPWWAKFIVWVGVPSAIALGLVWSDRLQLMSVVSDSQERLSRIESLTTTHDSRTWLRFEELSSATRETNRILMAQCVNEAKTSSDRDRCVGR